MFTHGRKKQTPTPRAKKLTICDRFTLMTSGVGFGDVGDAVVVTEGFSGGTGGFISDDLLRVFPALDI